jgi:hypothetical protein
MDYETMKIRDLHNLVHIVKRSYFNDVNKLSKEQCIEILQKFVIPTKDVITVIKSRLDKTKKEDTDYDF